MTIPHAHMPHTRNYRYAHAHTRLTAGKIYFFAVRINRSELCRPFLKDILLAKLSSCAYRISATNNLGKSSFFHCQIYQDRRESIIIIFKVFLKRSRFFDLYYFTIIFWSKFKYSKLKYCIR